MVRSRSVDINITDTSGNPLKITLMRLTRGGNSEFASLMRPIWIRNCEKLIELSPKLKDQVDDTINDIIASGGELPGVLACRAAFSPEGMATLIRIMTKDSHPQPIDDITVGRLIDEYMDELVQAFKELLPLPNPKTVGRT